MTRSLPSQFVAIRVVSLSDIIYKKVIEVTPISITLESIFDFNRHELIKEGTKRRVKQGAIIRVVVSNQITDSIFPKVVALEILSIET